MPSIPVIKYWWKRNEADTVLAAAFVLVAIVAFFGGRISAMPRDKAPIVIEVPESAMREQERLQQAGLVNLALPAVGSERLGVGGRVSGIPEEERKGEYVASKNGAYYYTADMYMATRIKAANRVWFTSREEAEAKGLKPAKGLE